MLSWQVCHRSGLFYILIFVCVCVYVCVCTKLLCIHRLSHFVNNGLKVILRPLESGQVKSCIFNYFLLYSLFNYHSVLYKLLHLLLLFALGGGGGGGRIRPICWWLQMDFFIFIAFGKRNDVTFCHIHLQVGCMQLWIICFGGIDVYNYCLGLWVWFTENIVLPFLEILFSVFLLNRGTAMCVFI